MFFTIEKERLLKLFKIPLFIAIEKKNINNIVGSHVLLEVADDRITVTATDLGAELIVQDVLPSKAMTWPSSIVWSDPADTWNEITFNGAENDSIWIGQTVEE